MFAVRFASKVLTPIRGVVAVKIRIQPERTMAFSRNSGNEVDGDECMSSYNYVFKPDLLKDKVAFITGGGSGIGFRITEVLMRHGCKTAIASRKIERVQEAAKKLESGTGGECAAFQVDVRQPETVEKTVNDILSHYGKIDILVNNAAGNFLSPIEGLSYNAFKTVIDIDTVGTFNVTKAVFDKYFKEHGGNVINITATLAYRGSAMQLHAGSAKAAIDAMIKHMAVEWGEKNIRVNGIAPGPIGGTEGMRRLGGKSPLADQMQKGIPLGRWGYKAEIADSALYLASDAASYVTGTVLLVDGGSWMTQYNGTQMSDVMKSGL
uniref:Peroxisomal 2,4-dienoyl-CoA reductase [(3E)-enoyl-CoA-producing] n=1 Tax=Phallusia mammillata TaxID=59560 RepID=A0A6F9DBE6_9ASCI|nr:peroxisomal 2,4-dienoyl-CoA reductase-like [Phallusia mammillata]